MSRTYRPPELLADHHDLTGFTCQSSEQTDWLRHHARQSSATGTTRVFVVTENESHQVAAYYAWCMAQVAPTAATRRLINGAGRYSQPVALLARLGVNIGYERSGLGAGLLQDVFARIVELSGDIGCRRLLVHAESVEARNFYLHLVPEFEPGPTDDLHLVLLMKDIRHSLRRN